MKIDDDKSRRALVEFLTGCQHVNAEQVDGGARWCPDCGAYYPAHGIVRMRHPASVTCALLIDKSKDPS